MGHLHNCDELSFEINDKRTVILYTFFEDLMTNKINGAIDRIMQ